AWRASEWLLDPQAFPLRQIRLKGEVHYLEADNLRELLSGYLGDNFFSLDITGVHRVLAAQPWVEHVELRRRWPDTLEVSVLERTPYGVWGEGEMVDVNGKRFRPAAIPESERWPRLHGPAGHELNLIARYAEANALVARAELRIRQLRLDERRAWWITFDNGIELSLGREAFMPRLQRFVDLYSRVLAPKAAQIAAVDLRYANGFAVRWRQLPPPGSSDETLLGLGGTRSAQAAG
ncbi:MAG TPA: cell division protein FtsQ/DivIB, partial [Candidatus Competibacteraceae bacterium]|nr:cell division protein FtsQ/DivIB [Candidatus Competibacteraceae bacterium]